MPHCPLEVRAKEADNKMGVDYFTKNRDKIRKDLLKYGAIWFRGFDLMKSVAGYREMHEALGLEPCLDPLHSSGLRKFASERDALYEEVREPNNEEESNNPSLQTMVVIRYTHKFPTLRYTTLTGQQTIFARSLHWLALRIHHETNRCLCRLCLLSKSHRRWWTIPRG